MAYEIRIERHTSPVTLDEWRGTVDRTDGVRLANGGHTVTNPQTGEVIVFGNTGGDAEVFFPAAEAWQRVLCWSKRGSVSFVAPADFDQPACRMRRIAATLAQSLNASLVGDEGETYD